MIYFKSGLLRVMCVLQPSEWGYSWDYFGLDPCLNTLKWIATLLPTEVCCFRIFTIIEVEVTFFCTPYTSFSFSEFTIGSLWCLMSWLRCWLLADLWLIVSLSSVASISVSLTSVFNDLIQPSIYFTAWRLQLLRHLIWHLLFYVWSTIADLSSSSSAFQCFHFIM